jgi:hypothetical protein
MDPSSSPVPSFAQPPPFLPVDPYAAAVLEPVPDRQIEVMENTADETAPAPITGELRATMMLFALVLLLPALLGYFMFSLR